MVGGSVGWSGRRLCVRGSASINPPPSNPQDIVDVINKNQPLPGGRTTGDALHWAIDELMRADDINAVINDGGALDKLVERHLRRGGILDAPATADPVAAVKQAYDPETLRRYCADRNYLL